MEASQIVYNQPHLMSKILYEFGGLTSKTAIAFKKDTKINFYGSNKSNHFNMVMRIQINNFEILQFKSFRYEHYYYIEEENYMNYYFDKGLSYDKIYHTCSEDETTDEESDSD